MPFKEGDIVRFKNAKARRKYDIWYKQIFGAQAMLLDYRHPKATWKLVTTQANGELALEHHTGSGINLGAMTPRQLNSWFEKVEADE